VLDGRAGGHPTRRSSCDPSGHKSCRSSPSSGDQGQGLEADQGAVIKAVWLDFFSYFGIFNQFLRNDLD
jgi:hypothetical protein